MPILYVNPARKPRPTMRVSGRASLRPKHRSPYAGTRPGMGVKPPWRPWAGAAGPGQQRKFRGATSNPDYSHRGVKPLIISSSGSNSRHGRSTAKRSAALARKFKAAAAKRRYGKPNQIAKPNPARRPKLKRKRRMSRRSARPRKKRKITMAKRGRKRNSKGRYTKRRRGRRTAAKLGIRRRRRKMAAAAPKRRRRRRKSVAAPKRRRRRRKASAAPKRRRRRRSSKRARAARKGHRRRKRYGTGNYRHRLRRGAAGPVFRRSKRGKGRTRAATQMSLRLNPPRRRRRRARGRRRVGGRRRRARRIHRRYRRNGGYRRNPGGMLMDLLKRALPVFGAFMGAKFLANKLSMYIPGINSLGAAAAPAVAVGTVIGLHYLAPKVAILNKHKPEIMLGAGLAAIHSLFNAFAPQAVKDMIGMGEYVGVGDDIYSRGLSEYVGVGGEPLDDDIAMNGYIQVSGDGAEEALGLDEELGVDEELGAEEALGGGLVGGGMPGGLSTTALQRVIPSQSFSRAIPARSFTRQIPAATGQFDNPDKLYVGIFSGGFGN